MTAQCPDPEALFDERSDNHHKALDHARTCPECAEMLDAHRGLERDLFQLKDPFPPLDFVSQVMAKVDSAPAVRPDIRVGAWIFSGSLALFALSLLLTYDAPTVWALSLASAVVQARIFFVALVNGVGALWNTAAVPTTLCLSTMLLCSLFGLRRLAGVTE